MRAIDAMTDQERIALLRHALNGVLTVIDEGYTEESQADEPRIVDAHNAMVVTAPGSIEQRSADRPPDYPDIRNDFIMALKHISNLKAIVDRIDETFGTDALTESEAEELAAVAEFIGDRTADVPHLTLYEAQVTDEGGYATRHFAWSKAEALSAATKRADELVNELHRHPMSVHTCKALPYTIALTKDGVLKFLNDEFSGLS